ncbi:hypothetical protein DFH08DRAFT_153302 [Mycena albidolilacea]|uniref:Uncharacterized protein n=1 Tax=Mycena albidolilacea TaxID=1033008 RepID=A0AAD7A1Y6_9AGAR|nr:hypothetical protein DFH08DRAFT_153302 [Mycena albidolilacea]
MADPHRSTCRGRHLSVLVVRNRCPQHRIYFCGCCQYAVAPLSIQGLCFLFLLTLIAAYGCLTAPSPHLRLSGTEHIPRLLSLYKITDLRLKPFRLLLWTFQPETALILCRRSVKALISTQDYGRSHGTGTNGTKTPTGDQPTTPHSDSDSSASADELRQCGRSLGRKVNH